MSDFKVDPNIISNNSKEDVDSALACLEILKGKTISNIRSITNTIITIAQSNAIL
jgi:hypothetical protein